jgi:hypothetical protein
MLNRVKSKIIALAILSGVIATPVISYALFGQTGLNIFFGVFIAVQMFLIAIY